MKSSNEISPESILPRLNKSILNLLTVTASLSLNSIYDKLRILYKETKLLELFYDKYIIVVSGLQGVGKSTLIKELYSLQDDILPLNLSRGEKLPVLFSESNELKDNNFETYIWTIVNDDNHIATNKQLISQEEFRNRLQNPNEDDFVAEIRLPHRILNDNNKSLMLLPGIENKDSSWQKLIKMSLQSAASCIFVYNGTKYASSENSQLLEEIDRIFENAAPIHCITHADVSKEENESIRKQIIEKYKIKADEINRVISTGTGDELKKEWMPQLLDSINKYPNSKKEFRVTQLKTINNLMKYDLNEIIFDIKSELSFWKRDSLNQPNYAIDEIMESFDSEVNNIRAEYLRLLKNTLDDFSVEPIKQIDKTIIERSGWKKFKKFMLHDNLEGRNDFQEQIINKWETSNGMQYSLKHTLILNEICKKRLYINNVPLIHDTVDSVSIRKIGIYDDNNIASTLLSDNVIQNIKSLFDSKSDIGSIETNKYLIKSVKAIPVIALEFTRLMVIYPEVLEISQNSKSIQELEKVVSDFEYLGSINTRILTTFGIIMGIDLSDGTIDSIPALFSALGITLTGKALAFFTAIGAIIGVSALTLAIMQQIAKMEFEESDFGRLAIAKIRETLLNKYLDKFDDIMNILRDSLIVRLKDRYHLEENFYRFEKLTKCLSDTDSLRKEIVEVIELHNSNII